MIKLSVTRDRNGVDINKRGNEKLKSCFANVKYNKSKLFPLQCALIEKYQQKLMSVELKDIFSPVSVNPKWFLGVVELINFVLSLILCINKR